ncbi:hypothetical protein H5410_016946 [Solanum commersonii]|uniref:Uncharacterized protein n=1 Tax=Solanum commersonii TaxID=4109 RepID=A0A9J5ZYP0_SOLCO|nr:hypothetical protein H5410_016946 [Solanum commersonii]
MVIRPTMLYEVECWSIKNSHIQKMKVAEMRMFRWMSGHTKRDKNKNEDLRDKVEVELEAPLARQETVQKEAPNEEADTDTSATEEDKSIPSLKMNLHLKKVPNLANISTLPTFQLQVLIVFHYLILEKIMVSRKTKIIFFDKVNFLIKSSSEAKLDLCYSTIGQDLR